MRRILKAQDGWITFHCPGCECSHGVPAMTPSMENDGKNAHRWVWNGNEEFPTIQPSLLVNSGRSNPTQPQCHIFVTNGQIHFLNDCSHNLAGQVVDMEDADA